MHETMKPKITERMDYILEACRGRQVLHLGCANAPYTEEEIARDNLLFTHVDKVAATQYGIDLSPDGIAILRARGFGNLAVADIEALPEPPPFADIDFDIVLAGDTIEHLTNPGAFLLGVRRYLQRPASRLLLTTVNAYCAYRFFYSLLTGREGVHPGHTCYFSAKTLTALLARCGYGIEDFSYYPAGRENAKDMKRGRWWLFWWVDRLAFHFHPMLGDGLIVTCTRVPEVGSGGS